MFQVLEPFLQNMLDRVDDPGFEMSYLQRSRSFSADASGTETIIEQNAGKVPVLGCA